MHLLFYLEKPAYSKFDAKVDGNGESLGLRLGESTKASVIHSLGWARFATLWIKLKRDCTFKADVSKQFVSNDSIVSYSHFRLSVFEIGFLMMFLATDLFQQICGRK